jgi:hypothetical protein
MKTYEGVANFTKLYLISTYRLFLWTVSVLIGGVLSLCHWSCVRKLVNEELILLIVYDEK